MFKYYRKNAKLAFAARENKTALNGYMNACFHLIHRYMERMKYPTASEDKILLVRLRRHNNGF